MTDGTARCPLDFVYDALPARVVFGAGRRSVLPDEVDRLGGRRVILVADGAATRIGDELADLLGNRLATRWDDVVQHVPVELATKARAAAADADADTVVTVGGGSATGLAKAIALTSGLPIVAVPTTYAGSEQTTIYGLTGDGHKQTGRDVRVLPKAVIYDPELTVDLPPGVTGASACNALAHSVEALWAPEANPVTSVLALEGVGAIASSLPHVMAAPGDLDGRGELLYGAYLSGVALATTSAGLHHKITHVLGGTFGLVHADAHSAVLPHVVAFNGVALPDEMRRLAAALGDPDGDPAGLLHDLAANAGVTTSLAALGLSGDDVAEAAERALAEIRENPRPVDLDDLNALLIDAFDGSRPAITTGGAAHHLELPGGDPS
jgi:maleylacetate reductase